MSVLENCVLLGASSRSVFDTTVFFITIYFHSAMQPLGPYKNIKGTTEAKDWITLIRIQYFHIKIHADFYMSMHLARFWHESLQNCNFSIYAHLACYRSAFYLRYWMLPMHKQNCTVKSNFGYDDPK